VAVKLWRANRDLENRKERVPAEPDDIQIRSKSDNLFCSKGFVYAGLKERIQKIAKKTKRSQNGIEFGYLRLRVLSYSILKG